MKILTISWSTETAIKVAPKIVSGLVVKILNFLGEFSILKSFHIHKISQSNFFALTLLFLAIHLNFQDLLKDLQKIL